MNANLQILDQSNFYGHVKNNDCLVIFFKSQCPNCKVLMKVMGKCNASHPEIQMAGVNSEENTKLLEELDVLRVPSILVYKNGELAARKVGVMKPVEMASLYYNV